jgi:hydrogenase maturation protein HypF
LAEKWGIPLLKVQHHYAHLLSCMAENGLRPPVLGVVWDGTGYGDDGTIWGGEFLLATADGWQRAAHLRPFRLPGGETAVREPRRSALGLLFARFGAEALGWKWLPPVVSLPTHERKLIGQMLEKGINAPVTTSAGRLFDGVAALLGLCQRSTFEGEAAMALEFAAQGQSAPPYRFALQSAANGPLVIDWGPLLEDLLTDISQGQPTAHCAARFHSALAEMIVAVAQRVSTNATSGGTADIALTGGCFQNRLLSELTIARLRAAGFHPHWHRQAPANDGGIALGQVLGGMAG